MLFTVYSSSPETQCSRAQGFDVWSASGGVDHPIATRRGWYGLTSRRICSELSNDSRDIAMAMEIKDLLEALHARHPADPSSFEIAPGPRMGTHQRGMVWHTRRLKDITKLTQDFSTYAGWRAAIEVALQLADSRNGAWRWDTMPARTDSSRDSDRKECLSRISDPGGVRNDIGECHAGRREKGRELVDEGE